MYQKTLCHHLFLTFIFLLTLVVSPSKTWGQEQNLQSLPQIEVTNFGTHQVTFTIRLPQEVKVLKFIAENIVSNVTQLDTEGKYWSYQIDLKKIGGYGTSPKGKAWGILSLPLSIPISELQHLNKLREQKGENYQIVGNEILLGSAWQQSPILEQDVSVYWIEPEHKKWLHQVFPSLRKTLEDQWKLKAPQTYPPIIIYPHQLDEKVFSGVNHGKNISFLVPFDASASELRVEGTPVLAHELLHLYTGKGLFTEPYALQSTDMILKEGFLTYGGLALTKDAQIITPHEFDFYLRTLAYRASLPEIQSLRPVIENSKSWQKLAYYKGALLANALTLELSPDHHFSDLFRLLIETPNTLATEDLSSLIQKHFNKNAQAIVEHYLLEKTPEAL